MFFWQLFVDVRSGMRLIAIVGLALVLMLPAVNVVSVLFGGGSEISYSFGLAASTCRLNSVPCLTYAELDLGNTGSRPQELVEIDLTDLPRWSAVDHYTVKIVASNDPFVVPVVTANAEQQRITVQGLAANQMITFWFVIPGQVTRDELRDATPDIRSAGRVIESSPKATALARAFRTAFAFLL